MKWTSTAVCSCFSPSLWTQQPYYVDLIWFRSPWHWGQNVRWCSCLNSRVCRESQIAGCHCCVSLDIFAIWNLHVLVFFRENHPCFPLWKLYFHSQFYCRLKTDALESYQLINKHQSSHFVMKLSHWSKWKFRLLAFTQQFLKVRIMCLWNI